MDFLLGRVPGNGRVAGLRGLERMDELSGCSRLLSRWGPGATGCAFLALAVCATRAAPGQPGEEPAPDARGWAIAVPRLPAGVRAEIPAGVCAESLAGLQAELPAGLKAEVVPGVLRDLLAGASSGLLPEDGSASKSGDQKSGKAGGDKPKKAAGGKAKEDPKDSEAPWTLPKPGYAKKLRGAFTERLEAGGVTVRVSAVPDGYRCLMAQGIDALAEEGLEGAALEKRLRSLHRQCVAEKGRVLLFFSLTAGGDKTYHFLQSELKEHVEVRGDSKKEIRVFDENPKPELTVWRLFDSSQSNQSNPKKLFQFTRLEFTVGLRLNASETKPLVVTLRNLARVVDRRAEKAKDFRVNETVNAETKQLSTSSWKGQIIPDFQVKFLPNKLRTQAPPAPKELEEILERLAEKRG